VLVFTEARDTLESLQSKLRLEQVEALAYHGELALAERDRQVARFRDPDGPKVLLSTEVGGEGRNFQFAHIMFNYDLPWNPMKLEQRIGRIHRFGQERDVRVTNLVTKGTIEAYLLYILNAKIGMFTSVVGEIETILAYMKSEARLDRRITEIVLESESPKQIEEAMRALGDEIEAAWKEYKED